MSGKNIFFITFLFLLFISIISAREFVMPTFPESQIQDLPTMKPMPTMESFPEHKSPSMPTFSAPPTPKHVPTVSYSKEPTAKADKVIHVKTVPPELLPSDSTPSGSFEKSEELPDDNLAPYEPSGNNKKPPEPVKTPLQKKTPLPEKTSVSKTAVPKKTEGELAPYEPTDGKNNKPEDNTPGTASTPGGEENPSASSATSEPSPAGTEGVSKKVNSKSDIPLSFIIGGVIMVVFPIIIFVLSKKKKN